MKSLIYTTAIAALLAIPTDEVAAEPFATLCQARNGAVFWRQSGCQTTEKKFVVERMDRFREVTTTATDPDELGECFVMREFLDGDIAVCVGYENNVTGYGFHCYMWLETSGLPVVKIYSRSYTPDDEVHRVDGDEVRGSIDSPDARDHTRGRHRAIIAFVDEGSPVVLDRADFLTEDGYHIIIEDILLTRHSNTEDCVASAIISARQR